MPALRSTRDWRKRAISTPSGCPQMPCCGRRSHIGLTRPVGRPSPTKVKRFHEDFGYQAQSWDKPRRVLARIEWHPGELFPRVGFIVTNLPMEPDWVVRFYNQRGTAEQHIKEGKYAFRWTRLSCKRFREKASSGRLSPKNEPGTDVFQDLGGLRAAVGGQVVQYHHVALVQGRGQSGFDVEVEEFPVHRPADHPRRIQPVMAQSRDEGLSVPVAEGGVIHQTRSAWCPPGRLGHVGLEGCFACADLRFVNECQPCQHVAHEGLAATDPYPAGRCDVRPLLLDGAQVFFCVSGQDRADAAKPRHGGPRPHAPHAVRPPVHQGSGRAFP